MRRVDHGPGQGHGDGQGRWYQEDRNFINSDTNMQPQSWGGYIPPSAHNPAMPWPLPLPLPLPFGNNALYIDGASGMIYLIYIPVPYHLLDEIKRQIDFYFSVDNLVKDIYLRLHMDQQGWVHVNLIARFHKVLCLTNNVQLILYVMQTSNVVEVQGDKMRRRDDWMRWLIPPGIRRQLGSQPQSTGLDEGHQLQPSGGDRTPLA